MSAPCVRFRLPEGLAPGHPELVRQQVRLERAFPRTALSLELTGLEGLAEKVDGMIVAEGARTLGAGGLVAFPTETVYGLGADARNPAAVRRLYGVKGRPGFHPVIVHAAGMDAARGCARAFTALAERLAGRFWPGALTLIVPKADWVPSELTGGQDSVGIRVPSHRLALALLAAFQGPVAAPSANRFGRVSPTSAEHVVSDLGSDVDAVIDGGPCEVGVESTIVDVRSAEPVILRPGGVTREVIEAELGRTVPVRGETGLRVSGGLPSHYAPRARVEVVDPGEVEARAASWRDRGCRVRVLSAADVEAPALYASLRAADESGADVVVAPRPEETGLGRAVADRLRRAAGPKA